MDMKLITALNSNISAAYFWLNEGSFEMSSSICSLLEQLMSDISDKKMIEKIKNLRSDIDTMYKSEKIRNPSLKELKYQKVIIEEAYDKTLELRIMWITMQSIMNLFNFGAYELGFIILMEVAEEWHLLYEMIIPNMKKNKLTNKLNQWTYMHLMFAVDLYGKDYITNLMEGDIDV